MTLRVFLDRLEQEGSMVLEDVHKKYRSSCILWLLKKDQNKDIETAKDIFSEAVLALWDNAEKGRIEPSNVSLKTYLNRICLNMLINYNTHKSRPSEIEFDELLKKVSTENPDIPLEKESLLVRVQNTIRLLDGSCAILFKLFYDDGLSLKEIAKSLEYASAAVVKTRLSQCRKGFAKLFGNLF